MISRVDWFEIIVSSDMAKRVCCSLELGVIFMVVSYGLVGGRNVGHAVRTIQSEDGDIVDCIEINKQPAFGHPALKNHTIQMTPSYDPTTGTRTETMREAEVGDRNTEHSRTVTSQLWQKRGRCPKGTIPVLRIQNKALLRSNSNSNSNLNSTGEYGRKKQPSIPNLGNESVDAYLLQANRSKAILLTVGYSYSGARGDIRVFNPYVESDDEYTTSRVSLKHGPFYAYESVESGWAVNPSVYGDRKTRLFVYWTADASKKTGCFDLTCPGFIQTNNEIALGAAIYPISVPGGLPYQITIYIYKDPHTENWWVQYGGNINIGYWPHELFKMLTFGAEVVEWGGEVYSSKIGDAPPPHTATAMGNGRFSDPTNDSGCIRRMRVKQNIAPLKFPDWVYSHTDEYRCYDAYYVGDYVDDPEFYYGGPGRNPSCP